MTTEISAAHKKRLEEIRKNLTALGPKESNFVKAELLFYESIEIARTYGNDVNENGLLDALKQLQGNDYNGAMAMHNKSSQREQAIRKFISQLKKLLSAGIHNSFLRTSNSPA